MKYIVAAFIAIGAMLAVSAAQAAPLSPSAVHTEQAVTSGGSVEKVCWGGGCGWGGWGGGGWGGCGCCRPCWRPCGSFGWGCGARWWPGRPWGWGAPRLGRGLGLERRRLGLVTSGQNNPALQTSRHDVT